MSLSILIPRRLILLLGLSLASLPAHAFEFIGNKWSGAGADIYISLNGISPSGISWNNAFITAMLEWNDETLFNFNLVNQYRDPCLGDGLNGVDFTSDICGTEYGDNTLAVTIRRYAGSVLGPARLVEADVVINEEVDYNVYDGPFPQFGVPGIDLRRVALHELGHVIGLDHESDNPAIMAPNIGNIDRLQSDDILGVNTLYSGLTACKVQLLAYGEQADALDASDCTVAELTVGGSDTSYIDVYQLNITEQTAINVEMRSASLDSVLVLADASLDFIAFDDKSSGQCDSSLSTVLNPGSYFVLANTFDVPPRSDCGNTGNYALTTTFTSAGLQSLGPNTSFLGDDSSAEFSGGISADGGASYSNRFAADQSLDISARISLDPTHVGAPGFLVVAAAINGEILVMNENREFIAYQPGDSLPRFAEKPLAFTENLTIAESLVPQALGINDIVVDFVVGYGLNSNPDEIYFHQLPINLTVVAPDS